MNRLTLSPTYRRATGSRRRRAEACSRSFAKCIPKFGTAAVRGTTTISSPSGAPVADPEALPHVIRRGGRPSDRACSLPSLTIVADGYYPTS
ncbi:hypothetical protein RHA1_ro01773 [Rhodococcus jostii RHA1]|uniref:Uncharacterized protein n=1 Tax=Rhodococcus jostii (strain RHA1) TaxID=101510 RepID=Q0SFV0_RHOJR|nr:hypothetical protein RHA1_ro01773 [Rhodococcus jostii RHA1]